MEYSMLRRFLTKREIYSFGHGRFRCSAGAPSRVDLQKQMPDACAKTRSLTPSKWRRVITKRTSIRLSLMADKRLRAVTAVLTVSTAVGPSIGGFIDSTPPLNGRHLQRQSSASHALPPKELVLYLPRTYIAPNGPIYCGIFYQISEPRNHFRRDFFLEDLRFLSGEPMIDFHPATWTAISTSMPEAPPSRLISSTYICS